MLASNKVKPVERAARAPSWCVAPALETPGPMAETDNARLLSTDQRPCFPRFGLAARATSHEVFISWFYDIKKHHKNQDRHIVVLISLPDVD